MKRTLLLLVLSTVFAAALVSRAPAAPPCDGPAVPLPQVCGAKLRDPRISCALPADVEGGLRQANFNVRQRAADLFSWQGFIALHWPALAGRRGVPDAGAPVTAPGPRVWETWKETSEVFRQRDGQPVAPEPWDSPETLPAACRGVSKMLVRDQKVDDELDADIQPTFADAAFPGTLTDQEGRRVRYEIRMNRTAFEYVVATRLWDGTVQDGVGSVRFPAGSQLVKAAWREVDGAAAQRFHTAEACLCEDGPGGALTDCRRQRMGLVGFHVMTKTPSAPQWVWSTFEQIDNVTGTHGAPASFNDPGCVGCATNRQGPPGFPNQTTRVVPIPSHEPDCSQPTQAVDNVARLNRDMRSALARTGSVLQRYELVSTQWPYQTAATGQGSQPSTVFEVLPALLGNTTLETYIQDSSSCMGCHSVAATNRTDTYVSADFTFTLNNAYPIPNTAPTSPDPDRVPRNPDVIQPPAAPVTAWDRQHWNDVLAGYRLATRTYELLPDNAGAKLHCGSCHLEGGGDPDAAWWVGMTRKYDYPATTRLYQRIDQCFERSLNGKAICDPDSGGCAENPAMKALITYMRWLDEQWGASHTGNPANGFPPLPSSPTGKASVRRGGSVFLQKCSYCHGARGQGRYESGVYYRPALWGPSSFNASAGMGQVPTLAAFVHANMPYGYGGSLTVQEAWDVACFIDAQARPGKTAGETGTGGGTVCQADGDEP